MFIGYVDWLLYVEDAKSALNMWPRPDNIFKKGTSRTHWLAQISKHIMNFNLNVGLPYDVS